MTLNELIMLRRDLSLTQEQMAKEIGLSRRAYIDIETGKARLRKLHILAAERVALHHVARGELGPDTGTSLVGAEWFMRLIDNAKVACK